jgi:hypothetical protein
VGAYHFSVIYWSGNPTGVLALGLLLALQLFGWLPPFRVLMVWMYDRTNSLLLAMLMHTNATASGRFARPPLGSTTACRGVHVAARPGLSA